MESSEIPEAESQMKPQLPQIETILRAKGRDVPEHMPLMRIPRNNLSNFLTEADFPFDSNFGQFLVLSDTVSQLRAELLRIIRAKTRYGQELTESAKEEVVGLRGIIELIRGVQMEIGQDIFGNREQAQTYDTRIRDMFTRIPPSSSSQRGKTKEAYKAFGEQLRTEVPSLSRIPPQQ